MVRDAWYIPRPGLIGALARNPRMVRALYPWARIVQRRAIAKAPRLTGKLQSRIRIVAAQGSLRVVSDATDEKGFPYPRVQERRRPYMRPAIRK